MLLQQNTLIHGFQLIEEEWIEEISSTARVFEHRASGAKLVQLENDDVHQVFTASFKTLPANDTGVAHIVEHTVCCASLHYPLKDTFMELDKGSLNTSLNACTYKDMTMYYCASQNEKDFGNLIEVYLDLIFHPLIHERPYLFKQEGWHYSLETPEEPITYSGIVYNEMNGEYMEPSARLESLIHQNLFPDTCYRYDSGGNPEAIVQLTEAEFLAFYDKFYKPHHGTLFLYGKGDLEARLKQLDGVLKDFAKTDEVFEIPLQKPFKKMKTCHAYYPVERGEEEEEGTKDEALLALSFVVGDIHDVPLRLGFEMLEHMLLKSPASPLYEVLLGQHSIGKSIEEGGYDTGKRQPTFSIVLNGSHKSHQGTFKKRVLKVLERLAKEGMGKDLIDAAFNTITFSLKEGDTPWEAKGVILSEEVQMGVLYDGHPFSHLKYEEALATIEAKMHHGYFEHLIQTCFLDNPHSLCALLEPDEETYQLEEERKEAILAAYKASLSEEALTKLILTNEALEQLQEQPNLQEDLERLPHLSLSDLPNRPKYPQFTTKQEEDVTWQWHNLNTQEIAYIHLLFDTKCVAQEDLTYLGLLGNLLTYVGTKHYSYHALENAINQQTGGLNCSIQAYAACENTHIFHPYLKVSLKVLVNKLQTLPSLLEEITCHTVFGDATKVHELIDLMIYEMERSFKSTPEYRSTRTVYTYCSQAAVYEDYVSGMVYYDFLKDLKTNLLQKGPEAFEQLVKKLEVLYAQVMQKQGLFISVTAPAHEHTHVEACLKTFLEVLPSRKQPAAMYKFTPTLQSEAFSMATGVQAITMGGNFKDLGFSFNGSLYVLNHIVDSTYLWDKVRLQGGAYGAQLTLGRDGNLVFCSYCDPELGATLDAFSGSTPFVQSLELTPKELERCIIGTVGGLTQPLTMEQKSEQVLIYGITQVTQELIEKEWEQVLHTTVEELRSLAPLLEAVCKQKALCVIGSRTKIMEEANRFQHIRSL
ncbi:MAG: insulinase family protein [Niameybacter sp.]|uniref:insulinase family protein n=1 Tax=Niameybacter sp. TaxID=2033640 RepID=UPI002FCAEF90